MFRNQNRLVAEDGRIVASRVGNILQVNVWNDNTYVKSVCIHRDNVIEYAPAVYDYFMRFGTKFLELEYLFPELGDIPCV